MNFLNNKDNTEKVPPAKGKLLIAEPFLHDKDFARSVVLLCEHTGEGTIGFVLNQPTMLTLGDLLVQLDNPATPLEIYNGGPVQPETLHIVHRIPDLLGGVPVAQGIYWGGLF
jgi:putative transcriptional regulator